MSNKHRAVQPERHLTSPLGDQRERDVPCYCGTWTFNICARCDRHCTCIPDSLARMPIPDPATARPDIPAPAGEHRDGWKPAGCSCTIAQPNTRHEMRVLDHACALHGGHR